MVLVGRGGNHSCYGNSLHSYLAWILVSSLTAAWLSRFLIDHQIRCRLGSASNTHHWISPITDSSNVDGHYLVICLPSLVYKFWEGGDLIWSWLQYSQSQAAQSRPLVDINRFVACIWVGGEVAWRNRALHCLPWAPPPWQGPRVGLSSVQQAAWVTTSFSHQPPQGDSS